MAVLFLYVWRDTRDQFDIVTNMAVAVDPQQAKKLICMQNPTAAIHLNDSPDCYSLEEPFALHML